MRHYPLHCLLGIVVTLSCGLACDRLEQQTSRTAFPPTAESVTVFSAGELGYACFRIPALVSTPGGIVLAFSEARHATCRDDADIDLVMRRSSDGGKTWGKLEILFDDGDLSVNQPAPVVNHQTGEVVLVFCKNNRRVFVSKSADDGSTWSEPREITKQVADPDWSYIGTGPGHGIQLSNGRLLISSWGDLSPGPIAWPSPGWGQVQFSYTMYSDDQGETWRRSEPLDIDLSDESMSVETAGGKIYMNMRSRGGKHMRAYAWSEDHGQTWSPVQFDKQLPEPSVQGSVIRFTTADRHGKNRILAAHPSSQTDRSRLTVRMSYDEGETWPVEKVLEAGSSAYSDLAIAPDMTILCLYEAGDYARITLARFRLDWLTEGRDRL